MTSLAGYQPKQELEVVRGELIRPYSELAHREIDITKGSDRAYLKHTAGTGRMMSQENWENYRRIGEVRYAVNRSARIAGYAQLRAVRVDRGGRITKEPVDGRVADIVSGIYSRFGGTRGLIERYYTLRKVPGEAYLVGVRDDGSDYNDGYWFLSPSEIARDDVDPIRAARNNMPIRWVTSRYSNNDGAKSEFERWVLPKDMHARIWQPDGEYTDDVQSPMQAINGMCEMLHTITEGIMSRLLQRFTLAGILLIPNDISDAAISGYAPADNTYSTDKVMNYLIHVMSRNVEKHNTNIAAMPILLKGPPESLDKLRHLTAEVQAASETDLKIRQELIGRILDSLDQQKAASTGGEGTNHWGMWAVGDEERRITVQPDLEDMCHALTRTVLWKELKALKWTDGAIRPWRVWFDLSAASVKSNMGEDARQAYDRNGTVNADFLRKVIGAGDADKMSDEEYVRWVGVKLDNPVLATYGLPNLDAVMEKAQAWGAVTPGPNPASEGSPEKVGPGTGDPGSPSDRDSDAPKTQEPG